MISLIQTAEGALNETHSILQRMRELTVQAGNLGTQEQDDLQAIQDELTALTEEIDGIAERTQFNGKDILTGDFASGTAELVFQIGANSGQQLNVNIESMAAADLGSGVDDIDVTSFTSGADFDAAVAKIDSAITAVSSQRSELGAVQNRLDHTINNLGASAENLTAAESRIRDVDYDLAAA